MTWKEHPCAVCDGKGNTLSGLPCICKGGGTQGDEVIGLRELVYEYEQEVLQLQTRIEALEKVLTRYGIKDLGVKFENKQNIGVCPDCHDLSDNGDNVCTKCQLEYDKLCAPAEWGGDIDLESESGDDNAK